MDTMPIKKIQLDTIFYVVGYVEAFVQCQHRKRGNASWWDGGGHVRQDEWTIRHSDDVESFDTISNNNRDMHGNEGHGAMDNG